MARVVMALVVLLALGPFLGATSADHSDYQCPLGYQWMIPADSWETSYPVYVAIDEMASNGFLLAVFVYAEWNDVNGLQRHDTYCETPGWEDPDLLIF